MLALQQKTNQRLRDLEIAHEEKASLLRTALLERENLPPELLELKRAETIQQIRERIDAVIQAPSEVQPKVLDTTSSEIAETVLSSEAALEKAKKVSIKQISHEPRSKAFDASVWSLRKRYQLDHSFSAATLITPFSPVKGHGSNEKSLSEKSISTAGTGRTTWGRMTRLLSPRKQREPLSCCSTEYFSTITSKECSASLPPA